jgi:hypothetical protein
MENVAKDSDPEQKRYEAQVEKEAGGRYDPWHWSRMMDLDEPKAVRAVTVPAVLLVADGRLGPQVIGVALPNLRTRSRTVGDSKWGGRYVFDLPPPSLHLVEDLADESSVAFFTTNELSVLTSFLYPTAAYESVQDLAQDGLAALVAAWPDASGSPEWKEVHERVEWHKRNLAEREQRRQMEAAIPDFPFED